MTPLADVREALVRAGADGCNRTAIGGPEPESPETRLGRIIAVVDQCMLPCHVTCHIGGSGLLRFDAANRRLMRVTEVPLPASHAASAVLAKPALMSSDAGDMAAALVEILTAASSLRFAIEPGVTLGLTDQGGLGAATLRQAAGISIASDHVARAIEHLGDTSMADPSPGTAARSFHAVVLQPSETDTGAPDPIQEWSRTVLGHLLERGFPLATALETDGVLCLGYGEPSPYRVIIRGSCGCFDVARL
jgi:hypothetical protein